MCSANGPSTLSFRFRVSEHSSPWRYNRCCLPVCTDFGQNPTGTKISELNTIQGGVASPYLSSSLPFCLRFNVELQRGRLISTLQNSIQGLGLRVTLSGTPPARSQFISSPHVQPRCYVPVCVLSISLFGFAAIDRHVCFVRRPRNKEMTVLKPELSLVFVADFWLENHGGG